MGRVVKPGSRIPLPGEVETGLAALSAIDRRLWGKVVANSFTVAAPKPERSRQFYGPAGAAVLVAGTAWGALGSLVGCSWLLLFLATLGSWKPVAVLLVCMTYVFLAICLARVWRCRKLGQTWREAHPEVAKSWRATRPDAVGPRHPSS